MFCICSFTNSHQAEKTRMHADAYSTISIIKSVFQTPYSSHSIFIIFHHSTFPPRDTAPGRYTLHFVSVLRPGNIEKFENLTPYFQSQKFFSLEIPETRLNSHSRLSIAFPPPTLAVWPLARWCHFLQCSHVAPSHSHDSARFGRFNWKNWS